MMRLSGLGGLDRPALHFIPARRVPVFHLIPLVETNSSMNSQPIVVEQVFPVPASVVWKAITDPDQMRQWFFQAMTEFRPEVGFETRFDVEIDGQIFPHEWKLTEVVPKSRLACQWRYGGFPGDSTVIWELHESDGQTTLTLTHTGQESFPQDIPAFRRESCVAGWRYFLQQSLKDFLEQS